MAKSRPYKKYVVKVDGKTVHKGITTDLDRREDEHKRKWAKAKITQVDGSVTEESAREWEEEQGVS